MTDQNGVLIIGAGGHGQVVADILFSAESCGGELHPTGFLDDDKRLAGKVYLGLPILGEIGEAYSIDHAGVIVAIGDNATRQTIYGRFVAAGERLVTVIHPAATIARDVEIGPGTVVCAAAVVNPGSRIGCNAILNTGCIVEHHCRIADHVHIAPRACLGGEVQVGEATLIGIGAVILPGVRIGERCVIGAGAVVTHNVRDRAVVVGVPAREVSISGGTKPAAVRTD